MQPELRLLKHVVVPALALALIFIGYGYISSGDLLNSIIHVDKRGDAQSSSMTLADGVTMINLNNAPDGAVCSMALHDGGSVVFYNFSDEHSSDSLQGEMTNQTQFRVASVSKVFTSIAILQLAEQGRLRLDDDVLKYIRFDQSFRSPTILELMLHTAGFDNNSSSFS